MRVHRGTFSWRAVCVFVVLNSRFLRMVVKQHSGGRIEVETEPVRCGDELSVA
jgi:hypothetical protein